LSLQHHPLLVAVNPDESVKTLNSKENIAWRGSLIDRTLQNQSNHRLYFLSSLRLEKQPIKKLTPKM
jgi:hypothetical protein